MDTKRFRRLNLWEVVLLIATFIFGIGINLYIEIPKKIDTASFWESLGSWVLRIHMLLGTAILVISIVLFINSKKFGKSARINSLRGLIAIFVALVGGVLFTFFGTNNIFSYVMAVGFVFALLVYTIMLANQNGMSSAGSSH